MNKEQKGIVDKISTAMMPCSIIMMAAAMASPAIPSFVGNLGMLSVPVSIALAISSTDGLEGSKLDRFAENFVAKPAQKWLAHTAQFDRDIS